ncbi:Mitochondrial inner membrane protease subunit 2 [Trichoplax sp. H2]|uniref:Mitochondrial inner membrane protease subunit n=1 Tax=Trichoplax adhaerens TaxID=10228 RepID=B3RI75_TRIAD|nr:hypothetical protein TRIADDRAFT_52376 [Trichoplax adhaerens]EDV29703.1 hypothetical protein TRIADDRAFT_52376 [Trichoplax adhaerens]RDD47179.1 Mitochondrial inner membrane protease subunit 2 [Trichoplax sp. H2]|eukprot:XP_002108905.1 hypothetical protein TRIADDRAFT_52376 [Trichoplax adhaerens]
MAHLQWKTYLKEFTFSGLMIFTVSYVGASTFRNYIGYISVIDGSSMTPTFNPSGKSEDYVFFSTWAIRHYEIKRGDVVAFTHPRKPATFLIKRVIALEGDRISTSSKYPCIIIPKGHCWVEGDGRNSLDSNIFGPIALGLIVGKASRIVWPYKRWKKVESFLPQTNLKSKNY